MNADSIWGALQNNGQSFLKYFLIYNVFIVILMFFNVICIIALFLNVFLI